MIKRKSAFIFFVFAAILAAAWMLTAGGEITSLGKQSARLLERGLYPQARKACEALTAALESRHGPEAPETLRARTMLAFTLMRCADYAQAEALGAQTAETQIRLLGADHPDTLESRHIQALGLGLSGNTAESAAMLRAVLEARKRTLGAEHPDSLRAARDLAVTARRQGQATEAEAALLEILPVQKRVLGDEHPETLETRHQLAYTLYTAGKRARARTEAEDTLAARRRILGPIHPDVSETLSLAAFIARDAKEYAQALSLLEQVLDIEGRTLGPKHPWALNTLGIIASTYYDVRNYAQAADWYIRQLDGREKALGAEHPDTLRTRAALVRFVGNVRPLADLYAAVEGNETRNMALHESLLAVCKRLYGADSAESVRAARDLAAAYVALKEYAKAKELYVALLAGKDSRRIRRDLALVYENLKDFAKAKEMYERVLPETERVMGRTSGASRSARRSLARVYEALNEVEAYEGLLLSTEAAFGAADDTVRSFRRTYAELREKAGDLRKAQACYADLLRTLEARSDTGAWELNTARRAFVRLSLALGEYAPALEAARVIASEALEATRASSPSAREAEEIGEKNLAENLKLLASAVLPRAVTPEARGTVEIWEKNLAGNLKLLKSVGLSRAEAVRRECARLSDALGLKSAEHTSATAPEKDLFLEIDGSYALAGLAGLADPYSAMGSGKVDLSGDGNHLLICQNGLIVVFNSYTGKELWRISGTYEDAFFYKNMLIALSIEKKVVFGDYFVLTQFDTFTGKKRASSNNLYGRTSYIGQSPDGSKAAFSNYSAGIARDINILDLETLKEESCPDNAYKSLLCARDRGIATYVTLPEYETNVLTRQKERGRRPLKVFSPSRRYIVSCLEGREISLEDRKSGEKYLFATPGPSARNRLALLDAAFTLTENALCLLDGDKNLIMLSLERLPSLQGIIPAHALPQGLGRLRQILPGSAPEQALAVFSLADGPVTAKALVDLDFNTGNASKRHILGLYPLAQIGGVAAAGGGPIYLAFADGALRSLDAYTGKIATLLPPGAQHWSALTLSMDGRRLFLGSRQGGVFLWEQDRGLVRLADISTPVRSLLSDDAGERLWLAAGVKRDLPENWLRSPLDKGTTTFGYLRAVPGDEVLFYPESLASWRYFRLFYDNTRKEAVLHADFSNGKPLKNEKSKKYLYDGKFQFSKEESVWQEGGMRLVDMYPPGDERSFADGRISGIRRWDNVTFYSLWEKEKKWVESPAHISEAESTALSPAGYFAAIPLMNRDPISFFNADTGDLLARKRNEDFSFFPNSGGLFPDQRLFVSYSENGLLTLWDMASSDPVPLLNWLFFSDGNWLAMDTSHRFDTEDIDKLSGLQWKSRKRPGQPVPFDAFMRDYYQPRLAEYLMNGVSLPEAPDLSTRNVFQHEVEIQEIRQATESSADVVVQVRGVDEKQPIYDLKLFRDRQLAGEQAGSLPADARGEATVVFRKVPLPRGKASATFKAYGFNSDNVRSRVAEKTFSNKMFRENEARRRVLVLSIGVNTFADAAWNLSFADNDAQALSTMLEAAFASSMPVRVTRLSTNGSDPKPTKGAFRRSLLDLLSTPDDTVIITIASHGLTSDGNFYILPADIPTGGGANAQLLTRAVSTEELRRWLLPIHAREIIMILDTCQSGAALGGESFKPGPMGNKGFGQLAYDKAMRVLCATNENSAALELGSIRHGLLSYALLEGLEDFIQGRVPDFSTRFWLREARSRSADIYATLRKGGEIRNARGRPVSVFNDQGGVMRRQAIGQEAYLFDFGAEALHLSKTGTGALP